MHSYVNGTSTKVKENNWDLISRFFVRTMPKIALDPGAIEGVMRGSPGYAVDMLEMLYTKFTLKKLPSMVPLMDDSSYGGPLDLSVQRNREVSVKGELSPGHRKPQTLTRRVISLISTGARRFERSFLWTHRKLTSTTEGSSSDDVASSSFASGCDGWTRVPWQ